MVRCYPYNNFVHQLLFVWNRRKVGLTFGDKGNHIHGRQYLAHDLGEKVIMENSEYYNDTVSAQEENTWVE